MIYFVHLFIIRCKLKEAGLEPNSMTLWLALSMALWLICRCTTGILNNQWYGIIGDVTQAKINAYYTMGSLEAIF